jgi:16S rRNA (adenine1518-N6/adenine1519-N6)-dimethyltransferase
MLKIVDALGAVSKNIVLEIGCGLGVMTAMLAERCKTVVAVDADNATIEIARSEFEYLKNVDWIHADILKTDIAKVACGDKLLVIGNIPYNISSPILFHLIDHRRCISRAVIMMQKEVAVRVVAKPGGKDYGALSVMVQSYAKCKKLFNVARTNFIPPPKVTSSIIELDFSESPKNNIPMLRQVVQVAFQKRRKTLRNTLLGSRNLSLKPEDLDRILAKLNIDPRRRPETLSVDEFHRLTGEIAPLC